MTKFFTYFGFVVLSILIFLVGISVVTSTGGIDKDKTFIPYIQESVPKLTTWKLEEYELLISEQGINSITRQQWELYINMFKKLGTLKSVGTPEFEKAKVVNSTASGKTTYAVYLVPVTFDTGLAHVRLGLQYHDGKVEINRVLFLSDRLLQ